MAKRKCKYGELKSPYVDKDGVKRTCRKTPKKRTTKKRTSKRRSRR